MSEPTIANLEARLAAIDARLTARATEGGARDEQAERALQRERLDAALSLAWELGMSDPARCRALSLAAQSRAEALGYDRGRALAGRNLGYLNLFGDGLEQAFQDVLAARDMLAALEDPRGVADCEDVLANIFLRLDALDRALEHSARCLELNERLGNQRGVGWAHHNLGLVHQRMGDGAAAEQEYKQAAACFQAIGHDHGLARIEGLLAHTLVERGELAAAAQAHARAIRLWGDNRLAGYSHISAARLHLDHGHGELTTAREHIARAREIGEGLDVPDMHAAIELLHARALLREGPEAQAEAERVLVALLENEAYQTVFARGGVFTTEREALELLAERCERRGEFERALRFLRRRVERERATVDADSRARARNMQISMGVAAAEREAQVVERLLLNTLPRPIVRELRLRGRVAPVHHAHATVLFTDFVGFTRIAAALEPAALVDELDRLFTDFDAIAQRRGLEKLKTIGDAY
ncbi:MAG: tetratricopeptide repeat protein, partial [Myxococcales bacterium]|nr:tetratricopeptide repeat protein [Myxococcales bacterium]